MSQNCIHLFVISFTVGAESGIALVAASDERTAIQILKSQSGHGCKSLVINKTRNIGLTSSCSFGLLMESYVNAKEAYDAIMKAANKLIGNDGKSAGFGEATAESDSGTGVPSVDVTTSGPDTAKNFHFSFHNIKGEKGDKGESGGKIVFTYDPVNKMLIISDSDARVENNTLIL